MLFYVGSALHTTAKIRFLIQSGEIFTYLPAVAVEQLNDLIGQLGVFIQLPGQLLKILDVKKIVDYLIALGIVLF